MTKKLDAIVTEITLTPRNNRATLRPMARILSVEDDEHLQRLIGQVLFREGYEMHYAWNGQEGYERILSLKPDLILLDLMLPLMNGVQLIGKLKAQKSLKDIPIIIVTSFGDEADILKDAVEALGAVRYLRKPVDFPEMIRSVKAALAQAAGQAGASAAPAQSQDARKGALRADPKLLTVWLEDRLLATLPQKEFDLLERLMQEPGPVSRARLLGYLGYEAHQSDALKQIVHRLRESLGDRESRRLKTTSEGYELLG